MIPSKIGRDAAHIWKCTFGISGAVWLVGFRRRRASAVRATAGKFRREMHMQRREILFRKIFTLDRLWHNVVMMNFYPNLPVDTIFTVHARRYFWHDAIARWETNQPTNQPTKTSQIRRSIHNIHRNFCVCLKKWHFNEYDEKLKRFSMLWCLYFSGGHYKAKHTIAVREHMRSWNISCTDILFTQPARPQNRRSKSRIRWKLGLFNTMKTAQPMCAS